MLFRSTAYAEWFLGLKDVKAKAKIAVRVNRIKAGNFGDCKSLKNGVSELKINSGPGYRVYFGKQGNEIIILIAGSTKANQQKAINKAKILWEEINK